MKQKIEPIPPKSVLRLKKNDGIELWKNKLGTKCRVGYYSKNDGLDVVWIVDQYGEYVETVEMNDLFVWFDVVFTSDLDDGFFGDNSDPIGPVSEDCNDWKWT